MNLAPLDSPPTITVARGCVQLGVPRHVRLRVPEDPAVGLVPDLIGVDRQRLELWVSSPKRASGAVPAGECRGIRGVVGVGGGRRVVLAGNRLRPGRRVIEDRQPAQVVDGQRARDAIVEGPVVVVDAIARRLGLARLPEGVGAGGRGASGRERGQLEVDHVGAIGRPGEQHSHVGAERDRAGRSGRRRSGRDRTGGEPMGMTGRRSSRQQHERHDDHGEQDGRREAAPQRHHGTRPAQARGLQLRCASCR